LTDNSQLVTIVILPTLRSCRQNSLCPAAQCGICNMSGHQGGPLCPAWRGVGRSGDQVIGSTKRASLSASVLCFHIHSGFVPSILGQRGPPVRCPAGVLPACGRETLPRQRTRRPHHSSQACPSFPSLTVLEVPSRISADGERSWVTKVLRGARFCVQNTHMRSQMLHILGSFSHFVKYDFLCFQ